MVCLLIFWLYWTHTHTHLLPKLALRSELWAKSIQEAASCQSKDNIACDALVCVSSFIGYQSHIDKSHLRRQWGMSNPNLSFHKEVSSSGGDVTAVTPSYRHTSVDDVSFIPNKIQFNRHLWNRMAADMCCTGQSLLLCSGNEQRLLAS